MEWVMRQLCFSGFVLLVGVLLGGMMPSAQDGGALAASRRLSVPILLYAAAEFCCYGRGAAVLLPIRMLELLYGICLYVGLFAICRLLRRKRLRSAAQRLIFPFSVAETTLLGYVLLRDGYCRSAWAAVYGTMGMAAAILLLVASAHPQKPAH